MFTLTRKERRALLLLAWTIVILTGLRFWWNSSDVSLRLTSPVSSSGAVVPSGRTSTGEKTQDSPAPGADQDHPSGSALLSDEPPGSPQEVTRAMPFDPNSAGVEEMKAAGLPGKIAYTIARYREKGGRFYRKSDLLKIYDMTDSIYARVEHLLVLPDQPITTPQAKAASRVVIDINQADEEEWTYLPGIGKGYARRICRFREALGGFAQVQQVGETFGLPDSTFRRIYPQLNAGTFEPPILVNVWDASRLAAHPYILPKEARILVNFRNQHGAFRTEKDVRRALLMMDTAQLQRLLPYLNYSNGD